MSDLSYMDKLLDGVEIEWKQLAEVGEFQRGKRFVKTDMISEGVPCIHYGEMYTHYGIWAKTSKSFVTKELASKLRVAEYGDEPPRLYRRLIYFSQAAMPDRIKLS